MAFPELVPAGFRDFFGGAVEGGDVPLQINREHPLGDAVQDQLVVTLKGVFSIFFHGLGSSSEVIHSVHNTPDGAICSLYEF